MRGVKACNKNISSVNFAIISHHPTLRDASQKDHHILRIYAHPVSIHIGSQAGALAPVKRCIIRRLHNLTFYYYPRVAAASQPPCS